MDKAGEAIAEAKNLSASAKTCLTEAGTVVTGIQTARDLNETINNKNLTTGQKFEKGAIQVVSGGIIVGGSTALVTSSAVTSIDSAGLSFAVGAAGVISISKGVTFVENKAINKLGLNK